MRRRVLVHSVERLLGEGESVALVAYLWRRHRWAALYAVAAFLVAVALAVVGGFEGWLEPVALGLAAGAVVVTATTEFRILAATDQGLVMLRSSSIRQAAVELLERLPDDTVVERRDGNLVTSDWMIGTEVLTGGRRAERELTAMATRS